MEVTHECMMTGIRTVKPGSRVREIGTAIEGLAKKHGYGVVEEYVGHGIGRNFHEPPQIPHCKTRAENPRFRAGMTFTIEPMINLGRKETVLDADRWTVRTRDGSLSAQFEHTVLVTPEGVDILTDWAKIS